MIATTEAPAAGLKPLHIHRLEIQNYMRIEALSVDSDGHHVRISAKNGAGKSSVLNAIWSALAHSSKRVPDPIHKGAERAVIRLDLGEITVERIFTEGSTRLIVTTSDGSRITKPQALLDSLLNELALDPLAFLSLRPQDQVDEVLSLAGVHPPVDQVAEICGDDPAVKPRPRESADAYLLRLSADETGLFYLRRREAHRAVEHKAAALAEQQTEVQRLGTITVPATATDLLAELDTLQRQADSRRDAMSEAEQARREYQAGADKLKGLEITLDSLAEEIAAVETRLASLKGQHKANADRIANGRLVVADMKSEADRLEQEAAALPDPTAKIATVRAGIASAEASRKESAKVEAANAQLERLSVEHRQAEAEHKRLDNVLEKLREIRSHLLDGVNLGVPGLAVGNGELRLNGTTFLQGSQAQRIRVACAVATLKNPRLKVLRVDDGEHLDSDSQRALFTWADEHGFQVLITCVSNEDGLRVEILDK